MSAVLPSSVQFRPSSTGSKTHLAGLDGVRALAVIGVLLYHSELPWFQGGFLGVDVFFVLSGFLITGLLAREFERTGGLDIRGFYLRRFRRLVPALVLLLLTVLIGSAFFVPDAAPRVRGDGLAALLYVSNWWLIANGQSYFEFISRPPLLQHLWSLAIEEQFYLLWPVCVLLLMWRVGRRGLGITALVLSLVSTLWMALLSVQRGYPEADPSRIYFGTDTHCMGLLLGAALAAFWQPWTAGPLTRRANAAMALLGVLSCAGVAYAYVEVGERAPVLYRGGFLLLSVVVCNVIVTASHPASSFGRLLGRQPLRWIGERSYGLYLWHWPIFELMRPGLDVSTTGYWNLALRLVVTAVVTDISYRVVESPIRDGAIGRFIADWRRTPATLRAPLVRRAALAGAPFAIMLALGLSALAITPAAKEGGEIAPDVAEAMGLLNGGATKVTIERAPALAPKSGPIPTAGTLTIDASGTPSAGHATPTTGVTVSVVTVNSGGMTAVGDSVLLGARFQLEKSILGTQTDAEVGRQAAGVLERVRELRDEDLLAPTVLLHLGTNGYITERQFRKSLKELADRKRVIVINAHAPRRWVLENNEMLARVVPEYPNAVLVNWADMSTLHPEFFASDDIHLTANGQQALVQAVIRAGGFPVAPPKAKAPRVARQKPSESVVPAAEVNPEIAPEPAATDPAVAVPALEPQPAEAITPPAETVTPPVEGIVSLPAAGAVGLIRHHKPMPLDSFWQAMASCETGSDWKNAGRYAGGLGIYITSWEGWGGREFAATPAEATPAEQIIVANRISTQGWMRPDHRYVKPVGFGGWGCMDTVGQPQLLTYEPASVLAHPFTWHQRGEAVRDLQAILGLPRDGVYGKQTWLVHVRHLESRDLSRALAPAGPPDAAAVLSTR